MYKHALKNNSTTSTMMRLPRVLPGQAESLGVASSGPTKDLAFEEPVARQFGEGHHCRDQARLWDQLYVCMLQQPVRFGATHLLVKTILAYSKGGIITKYPDPYSTVNIV